MGKHKRRPRQVKSTIADVPVEHLSKMQWVPLGRMVVSGRIQRVLRPSHVDYLVAHLDLSNFGFPTLNLRDGVFYIIDGQHRRHALEQFLGEGWEEQKIECRVFEGLSEKEEADMFVKLNTVLRQSAFDLFKNCLHAGYETETKIEATVTKEGLNISRTRSPGAITAVNTLRRVYTRSDADTLGKALRIIRDAFGDAGFESPVIDGLGHLCQRYNGVLKEAVVAPRLGSMHGGVKGLLNRAAAIQDGQGGTLAMCVAEAAVEAINHRARGDKIPPWKKMQMERAAAAERVARYKRQQSEFGVSA